VVAVLDFSYKLLALLSVEPVRVRTLRQVCCLFYMQHRPKRIRRRWEEHFKSEAVFTVPDEGDSND